MKPVGGYFELELGRGQSSYHSEAYDFKSGRASLLYILRSQKATVVYIPFYTCDGLLEPFVVSDTRYVFYPVNKALEPEELPELKKNEFFLYINYFDLKRKCVSELSDKYGDKLIVDCTQAFFMKGNGKSWYFNSCRKFFGIPDGSFLYPPSGVNITHAEVWNEKFTVDHLLKRFNGHPEAGYQSFLQNENLCGPELTRMSKLSEHLLSMVDFKSVIKKRRSNFYYLQSVFCEKTFLDSEPDFEAVPMFFPALWDRKISRKLLGLGNIFIPTFWEDVIKREHPDFELEKELSNRILPLPVDHRYKLEDMVRMETVIKRM